MLCLIQVWHPGTAGRFDSLLSQDDGAGRESTAACFSVGPLRRILGSTSFEITRVQAIHKRFELTS